MYQAIVYEWYNNFDNREVLTHYQSGRSTLTFGEAEDSLWDLVETYTKKLDEDGVFYFKYIHSDTDGGTIKVKIDIGGEGRIFKIDEVDQSYFDFGDSY